MSRTDEGKESETNEDKQKNEVRDTFTTMTTNALFGEIALIESGIPRKFKRPRKLELIQFA